MLIRTLEDLPSTRVSEAPGVATKVIKEADEAELKLFDLTPGAATPYHTHAHSHEVVVLSGTGLVRDASVDREVSEGDVVSIAAHEHHSFVSGPDGLRFMCLDCLFG